MTQQETVSCKMCGGAFNSEAALKAHAQQDHSSGQSQSFLCPPCGGVFDTQEALQAHARTSHPH